MADVKIKLKKAVAINGAPVGEISLREPSMNDVFASGLDIIDPSKITPKQINTLISNLAQWTPEEVGGMSPGDWLNVSKRALDFLK